jgi:hypothetical protein
MLCLGLLVFGYSLYVTWFQAAPRFMREWRHADTFVPAWDARIITAKCENFDIVIANNCVVKAVTKGGEAVEITDWRFGRAPQGQVHLMERDTVPPRYSTDISLRTLDQRLAMFVLADVASVLFGAGLLILMWRLARTGLGGR